MASVPGTLTFEDIGDRLFAFYPPILNIEHNEWRMKRIEWSEMLVENPRMALEIWVPRTWLGEVSRVDEPHLIIGLKRELEYKGGSLIPYQRKVVDMPRPNIARPAAVHEITARPSVTDEIRRSTGAENKLAKGLLFALAVALTAIAIAVGLSRLRSEGGRIHYESVEQRNFDFTADSTFHDVVRKLGSPEEDHWRPGGGERAIRALVYQKEGLIILLMGPEQNDSVRYIGAKDMSWRTVHSVELPGGRTTEATLASLQRF